MDVVASARQPQVRIGRDEEAMTDLVNRLRPRLTGLSPAELPGAVRTAVDELGPVRVTTFLPILVERRIRDRMAGRAVDAPRG